MPIQTSYPFQNDALLKGMKADCLLDECITAYSDQVIPVGVGLAYGGSVGSEGRVKVNIPSATGFVFMGISAFTHKENSKNTDGFGVLNTSEVVEYRIGDDITVAKRSRRKVFSETAVNPTLPVFLRHTTNGALTAGNFRTDADTARADQVTQARWVSVTTGAGLATLEIDLP
jgi:hypothetical protein